MIKFGKLTDYAIVIMGQLIKEESDSCSSACYIANKTSLPEPTVSKILKKLSNGNLIISIRGASGGYKINQPIDEISISDIIKIFEGPVSVVACCADDFQADDCLIEDSCLFKGRWGKVNREISAVFDNIKLMDMLNSPCNTNVNITSQVLLD